MPMCAPPPPPENSPFLPNLSQHFRNDLNHPKKIKLSRKNLNPIKYVNIYQRAYTPAPHPNTPSFFTFFDYYLISFSSHSKTIEVVFFLAPPPPQEKK